MIDQLWGQWLLFGYTQPILKIEVHAGRGDVYKPLDLFFYAHRNQVDLRQHVRPVKLVIRAPGRRKTGAIHYVTTPLNDFSAVAQLRQIPKVIRHPGVLHVPGWIECSPSSDDGLPFALLRQGFDDAKPQEPGCARDEDMLGRRGGHLLTRSPNTDRIRWLL